MNDNQTLRVFDFLKKHVDVVEVCRIYPFLAYRNARTGKKQRVEVEILDAGPDVATRYHVRASTEDGRVVVSDGYSDLDVALALAPWNELDKP